MPQTVTLLPGDSVGPEVAAAMAVTASPTEAGKDDSRFTGVKSMERLSMQLAQTAKEKKRLEPALSSGNFDKTMNAPVTAIIANDYEFYEHFDFLFPHDDARSWFTGNQALIDTTAMRNGSLQGAYFMLACRAIGLDVGPMSGFENNVVDAEFFKDTKIRSNFLCNLGYGDTSKLFPRSPRFAFEEVCTLL